MKIITAIVQPFMFNKVVSVLEITMLTPHLTFTILLVVQAGHLLHHRLAKRHISFAEVVSAAVLCVPLNGSVPGGVLMTAHLALVAMQIMGSLWLKRLSPDW